MDQFESEEQYRAPLSKRTAVALVILAILAIGGTFVIYHLQEPAKPPISEPPKTDPKPDTTSINFEPRSLETTAYEITYSLPTGNSTIENIARSKIEQVVQEFSTQADLDRQVVLAEEGQLPFYLQRPYVLNIENEVQINESLGLVSIISAVYSYTGGANGNSYYLVSTVDPENQELKSLGALTTLQNRALLKELVVEHLESKDFGQNLGNAVLFPEALQNLDLDTVPVAFNQTNMILYFDEYQIGPGVLGSFTLEIPLDEIRSLIELPGQNTGLN